MHNTYRFTVTATGASVLVENTRNGQLRIYTAADLPWLDACPIPIIHAIAYRVRLLLEKETKR